MNPVSGDNIDTSLIKTELEKLFGNAFNHFEFILLVGSRSVGLGNNHSDIDLLIVTSKPESLKARTPWDYIVTTVFGIRAEILVMNRDIFSKYLNEIETTGEIKDNHRPYKFICGKLLYGHGNFNDTISRFDKSSYMATRAEVFAETEMRIYEDLAGALKEGDEDSIVYWAKDLVENNIDALLCSQGDFYDKPKWRMKRAYRLLGHTPTYSHFRQLMFNLQRRDSTINDYISRYIKFSNTLKIMALSDTVEVSNTTPSSDKLNERRNRKIDELVRVMYRPKTKKFVVVSGTKAIEIETQIGATYLCVDSGIPNKVVENRALKLVNNLVGDNSSFPFDFIRCLDTLRDLELIHEE